MSGHNQLYKQVYDSVLGWMGFRQCGRETFNYVNAAMTPKYLLSSGSMSELSLVNVSGQFCEAGNPIMGQIDAYLEDRS